MPAQAAVLTRIFSTLLAAVCLLALAAGVCAALPSASTTPGSAVGNAVPVPAYSVLADASLLSGSFRAFFSPSTTDLASVGDLLLILDASDGSSISPDDNYTTGLTLSLPAGWTQGPECIVRYRLRGEATAWFYGLTQTALLHFDGTLYPFETLRTLSSYHTLYIRCLGVTPGSPGGAASFTLHGASGYAASPSTPATLGAVGEIYTSPTLYIGFAATLSAAQDLDPTSVVWQIVGSAAQPLLSLRRTDLTMYATLGYTGVDRVLVSAFSHEEGLASLATLHLTTPDLTWTYLPASAQIGAVGGVWQCGGHRAASVPCVQSECSNADQVCLVAGQKNEYACALVSEPPASGQCKPFVTSLEAVYLESSNEITVSFGLDATLYTGTPTLLFTLSASPIAFDWSCTTGMTCDVSGFVLTVAQRASGATTQRFTVSARVRRFSVGVDLTISVEAVGGGPSLAVAGNTIVALQSVGMYSLGGLTQLAGFAPADAAVSPTGRLAVLLEAPAGSTINATLPSFDTLYLGTPSSWSFTGATCFLNILQSSTTTPRWFLAPPSVLALRVQAASVSADGMATFASPPTDFAVEALVVVCDGVTPPAEAEDATVSLAFESSDINYFYASTAQPAQISISPLLPKEIILGFEVVTSPPSAPSFNGEDPLRAALAGSDPGISYAFARTGADAAVAVSLQFKSQSRAYAPLLARASVLTSLATDILTANSDLVYTYDSGSSFSLSGAGLWRCADPGATAVEYPVCGTVPAGCSNVFQGDVTCVSTPLGGASPAPSNYACAFLAAEDRPAPKPEYNSCSSSLLTEVEAAYNRSPSRITVKLTADSATFVGTPTVSLTFGTDVSVFDWSGAVCSSPALCTYADGEITADIVVSHSSLTQEFTLESPVEHWAAVAALELRKAVIKNYTGDIYSVPTTFSLTNVAVYTLTGLTASASFAPASSDAQTGRLVLAIEAAAPGASLAGLQPLTDFLTMHVTVPTGWSLTSTACAVRAQSSSVGSSWVLALPHTPATLVTGDGVLTFATSPASLRSTGAVYVICDRVSARTDTATTGETVAVVFESPVFQATVASTAALSYSPATASTTLRYVGFTLALDSATDVAVDVYFGMLSGGDADISLALVRSDMTVAVTVGLVGASRALEGLLARASAISDLTAQLTAAAASPAWSETIPASTIETGDEGAWKCLSDEALVDCTVTPPGCGDAYQSDFKCEAGGVESIYACALPSMAAQIPPTTDHSGCGAFITELTAEYSAGALVMAFKVDETLFSGSPLVLFALNTPSSVQPVFDWSDPECSAEVSCFKSGQRGLTAMMNVSSSSVKSFTVQSPVVHWAETVTLTIDVLRNGDHVIAAPLKVFLVNLGMYSMAPTPVAYFALDSAAEDSTGQLVFSIDAGASPLLGFGAGDAITLTVALPDGWALGSVCSLRARSVGGSRWLLSQAGTAAASDPVTGVITFPAGSANLTACAALTIICDDVIPATSTFAPVDLRFEGASGRFLANATAPALLSFDRATVVAERRFIGFNATLSVDSDVDTVKYLTPLAGGDDDVTLALIRSSTTVSVTIGLENGARALEALLSTEVALASLAADVLTPADTVQWTFTPTGAAIVTGDEGAWLCESSFGGYDTCVITPIGCGDAFQGDITCTTGGAESKYACALPSMPQQPEETPDRSGCGALVNALTATYASEIITVTFDVNADLISGTQSIVFTVSTFAADLFDWSSSPTCTGASASCTSSNGIVFVKFVDVIAGATFTIASPVARWSKTHSILVDATLEGVPGSVVNGALSKSFPFAAIGVSSIAVQPRAFFSAADPAAPLTGTLLLAVDGQLVVPTSASAALSTSLGAVRMVSVSLPTGWSLGSACTVHARAESDPRWFFGFGVAVQSTSVTAADVIILPEDLQLSDVHGLYIVCEGITAAVAAAGDAVTLSLEGASVGASSLYLAEVSAAAGIAYAATDALLSSDVHYVGARMAVSPALASVSADALKSAVVKSSGTLAAVLTARGMELTVGLTGANRVFVHVIASDAALTSLAAAVLSDATTTWTYATGSLESGAEGEWLCAQPSGATPALDTCRIAPAGCGTKFQGNITCATAGAESAYACALPSMNKQPEPKAESGACAPEITSLAAEYTAASSSLLITYGVDELKFSGSPSLKFNFGTSVAGLFDWSTATCNLGCVTAGGVITVRHVSQSGSFTLVVKPTRWSKSASLSVGVTRDGSDASIVAVGVRTNFILPALLIDKLVSVPMSATFAHAGADETGTLLVTIGSLVAPANALSTVGTANVSSIALTLPPGWSLGSACAFRARASADSLWVPHLASIAATAVTPSGVNTVSLARSVDAIFSLYITCSNVTPAAAPGTPVSVSLEGVGSAYLVEATGGSLVYSTGFAIAHAYAGFTLTSPHTVDEQAIATLVRGVGDLAFLPISIVRMASSFQVAVTLNVTGTASAYTALLTQPTALTSLAGQVLSMTGTWSYEIDSAVAGLLGHWRCGSDNDGYGPCEFANACGSGSHTAPVACVADDTELASVTSFTHSCAFDAVPDSSDASGCGSWMCKSTTGTLVACSHAGVCADGCAESLSVSNALIAANAARFAQFCVVAGTVVPDTETETFCPSDLVEPAGYSLTCNAVTACGLSCMSEDGIAKSCDSELSWSECNVDEHHCGDGSMTRHVYCSADTFDIGTNTTREPSVVSLGLCNPVVASIALTQPCSGAYCAEYAWKCDDGEGGLSDCMHTNGTDVDVGYAGCDGLCGQTTQTRNVHCVSYTADKLIKSTATDERFCLVRAPKPAISKPCSSDSCAMESRQWQCYPAGGNPALAASCADDFGFECPTAGCLAASTQLRTVACFDVATRITLSDAKCSHMRAPMATLDCAPVSTNCYADYYGARCTLDSTGEPLSASELDVEQCIAEAGDASGVFRRGTCRDRMSGAAATGACADTMLLNQCTFPVCAERPIEFTWRTADAGACIPGCRSYRLRTVTCVAATDAAENVAVVDESLCTAADRPPSFEPCAPSTCGSSGLCDVVPVFVDGSVNDDIFGACRCPLGFGGAQCSHNATFVDFSVKAQERVVLWSFADTAPLSMPFVTVSVVKDTPTVPTAPVVLFVAPSASLVSVAALAFSRLSSEHHHSPVDFSLFSAGNYVARIAGAFSVFNRTSLFQVTGSCHTGEASTQCVNGGQCNISTGICDCVGDFSGPTCAISPCPARGCHRLTSWCDITPQFKGICVCRQGFTGDDCDTLEKPCESAGECLHGGWRTPVRQQGTGDLTVDVAAACGGCQCSNRWTGSHCQTCSLQCANGGSPDSECGSCLCRDGFHGESCEYRHADLKLNFHKLAAFDWYESAFAATAASLSTSSPASVARSHVTVSVSPSEAWLLSLERTVDSLVRVVAPHLSESVTARVASYRRLNDTRGAEYIQVRLRVGEYSQTPGAGWSTREALQMLRPLFVPSSTYGGTSAAEGLTALAGLYMDRGVGMRDVHCISSAAAGCSTGTLYEAEIDEWTAEPARNVDPEPLTTSSGSGTAIGVGVGVSLGCLALLLAALYYLKRTKRGPFAKPLSPSTPSSPTSVEMVLSTSFSSPSHRQQSLRISKSDLPAFAL